MLAQRHTSSRIKPTCTIVAKSERRHPAGVGVWRFTYRRGSIDIVARANGHTAKEAFDHGGAGAELGWPGFNEVECELLSDTVEGAT